VTAWRSSRGSWAILRNVSTLMFMVDETRASLSTIFECINAFADLKLRKTAPFPPEIATKIEAGVAAGATLDWPPPVCGAMRA
jgi:acyl-CoA thioester hydrolase